MLNSPLLQKSKKAGKWREDNATMGIVYFLISSFIVSSAFTMSKFMYQRNPNLTPSLLLWYGAITSAVFQTAWLGFELKFYMLDSVN